MAARLDVDARLAEGRVAVEHTQTYVQAGHALGYQHPDLTAHPAQIREWYASEDGLDLRALDRDCAELRAAGLVAAEALRIQRAQVAALAAAWTGPGGDAAVQLLQRHCDIADALAAELRAAAQRCESLRDNLWHLIDSKVATAIAVDDRTQAQRPAWLAAAAAIAEGNTQGAEDVVRGQVIPYVDNDIRNEWLDAMRSTSDGVQTSYAMVIDRAAAAPTARFEFPGDLGASVIPVQLAPPVAAPALRVEDPAATVAAAAPAPVVPTPAPPVPAPTADWGTGLGDASGLPAGGLGDLGGLGSGLGSGLGGGGFGGLGGSGLGGGGGLLGLAGRIVDAMGDVLGSAGDGTDGAAALNDGDDVFDEKPFDADDPEETVADKAPDDPDEPADAGQPEPAGESQPEPDDATPPVEAPPPADTPPPADAPPPADTSPPDAPPAAPVGEPAPAGDPDKTPCEIAADQLPQAGQ